MPTIASFLRHCGRCFVTGTERIGAFSQHNLLVGAAIVGALIFGPLAGGFVGAALGFAALIIPSILLAAFVLFLVFAVGSYTLAPRAYGDLVLDVRYGVVSKYDPAKEYWAGREQLSKGGVFSDEVRIWMIGDILIVNRTADRVVLRIRVRVPNAEDEFAFASAICVRERTGIVLATDVGDVPHLPTEIVLLKDEHARGHTEFVVDAHYLDTHYPNWRDSWGEIEIEDMLTGRFNGYPRETTPTI